MAIFPHGLLTFSNRMHLNIFYSTFQTWAVLSQEAETIRLLSDAQATERTAYSSAGDLLTLTDPDSNATTYTYNAAHELATATSPTGGITTYLRSRWQPHPDVDPDGHEIQYGYDRPTARRPRPGSTRRRQLRFVTYTYDGDGEVTRVTDNNATYQFTYNAEGEVTSQADVGSANLPTVTLTYSYDPAGNETSLTDSLGGVASYTYDARTS